MYPLPTPIAGLHIEPLGPRDVPAITRHLLALSPEDRGLRFAGHAVTDDTVQRYVGRLRFRQDALLGVVGDGRVLGLAHGCLFDTARGPVVEAAFSVDAEWRGLGLGKALMQAVQVFARDAGAAELVGMCLARNLRMCRVFAAAGMSLTREDDEVVARSRPAAAVAAGRAAVLWSGRSGKLAARHHG